MGSLKVANCTAGPRQEDTVFVQFVKASWKELLSREHVINRKLRYEKLLI